MAGTMPAPFGQLHNSLNGGSLGHGGMELGPPATPIDTDTPLVPDAVPEALLAPDALLNVDTPPDDRPDP
jgi:hypothetical protein